MRTGIFQAVAVAASVTVFSALPMATVAQAVPGPNGSVDELAVVGSDTTQDIMGQYSAAWTALSTNDNLTNVRAFGGGTQTVPGDLVTSCATTTYSIAPSTPVPPAIAAPNSSSAGLAALKSSVLAGDGCIDIARSSRGRDVTTDLNSFEFYAYATDAVSWATFPGNASASKDLTQAQLKGIYNCTFTNWNQVGGANRTIKRYLPQTGSGTGKFFVTNVLGFDPLTTPPVNPCPAVNTTQPENNASGFTTAMKNGAIIPFSSGQWIAQGNGVATPDSRNSIFLGKIGGVATVSGPAGSYVPTAAGYTVTTTGFPGARYVYNVIDTTSVQYAAARRAVGYVPFGSTAGASKLCTPGAAGYGTTISQYGFRPLTAAVVASNGANDDAGTLCFRV